MTQDDMPAPAVVDTPAVVDEVEVLEAKAVAEEETAVIEYVPPSPVAPSPKPKPVKPAQSPRSAAPDAYAVGVRVLKMAPAWLLFTAVCCSVLILMLGWVRSSTEAEALPAKRNDARAAKRDTAAAKVEAGAPVSASLATASSPKTTAANDAPAAAPKVDEKARVETFAQGGSGEGKFTAQVGSFNNQSEANERVSSLRAAGFEAQVAAAELPGRGTWYRVQVGRFADKGEAAKAVAALRAKGAATAALVVPVQ